MHIVWFIFLKFCNCRSTSWTRCWLLDRISILQWHFGQHNWNCSRADWMDIHWS